MSTARPFFLQSSGELDTDRILYEAIPLAKLVAAVGLVALVPVFLRVLLSDLFGVASALGLLLTLATQFVLAVGTGIILMYVVVRAIQIAED